jgi:hypothetical protein
MSLRDSGLLVAGAGLATFFFGFFAGAILNVYLIAIGDPTVHELRTLLTYKSAILGDGILLPIANMAAAAAMVKRVNGVSRASVLVAVFFGLTVTTCVHAFQATQELVNWSMPTPWRWNAIGLWHAAYMASVISWLALFVLFVAKAARETDEVPRETRTVLVCVVLFLVVLCLDYRAVDFSLITMAP